MSRSLHSLLDDRAELRAIRSPGPHARDAASWPTHRARARARRRARRRAQEAAT